MNIIRELITVNISKSFATRAKLIAIQVLKYPMLLVSFYTTNTLVFFYSYHSTLENSNFNSYYEEIFKPSVLT
jgi:hypothetical protein